MKPETPATGISKIKEFDDGTVAYQVECDCTNPECAISNWVEVNGSKDVRLVELTWYAEMHHTSWDSWEGGLTSRAKGYWNRFKTAMKLLFTGHIVMQHDMCLSEQTARNWLAALEQSIDDLDK